MKLRKNMILGSLAALILVAPAWATARIVTLNVSKMTCAACPITVKKALEKVPGVSKVEVSFEKKQAQVTFDDAKTNTDALLKATRDAGYPSEVAKDSK
ncbi:MAG TPA: mercury resistance system periplasmic binding protein MerP [Bryobacteraceae bacterium]|nr:mercury resistance system periplasmic binding protein MerP [Bryobacteraceae bacterium]